MQKNICLNAVMNLEEEINKMRNEIMQTAIDSILEIDEDKANQALEQGKENGISAVELLQEGFSKGMSELGDRFGAGEAFLPELIFASEVMKIATDAVDEELAAGETASETAGTIVIGTVEGDVHDIGKGICVSMLKASGFEVYDLGREVSAQTFIDKAKEVNADIIASSALLTTTMPVQKEIEELLEKEGLKGKIKTMVGGAPVTKEWADKIGATAYSEDAVDCCRVALKLMSE